MRSPIYIREQIEADREKGARPPCIEFPRAGHSLFGHALHRAGCRGVTHCGAAPNSTVLDIFSLRTGSTAEKFGNAKDLVGQVGTHSPAF